MKMFGKMMNKFYAHHLQSPIGQVMRGGEN